MLAAMSDCVPALIFTKIFLSHFLASAYGKVHFEWGHVLLVVHVAQILKRPLALFLNFVFGNYLHLCKGKSPHMIVLTSKQTRFEEGH